MTGPHCFRAGTDRREALRRRIEAAREAQVVDITERRRAEIEKADREALVLAAGGAITGHDDAERHLIANAIDDGRRFWSRVAAAGAVLVAAATAIGWGMFR